ncbi:Uncharacterised protein [Bacillus freudenreichii]|nr:Uncharacterised protein [Bacillus freudenreichii]
MVHRLKGQKHTNGQDFQLNGVIYNKQGNSKDEFPCLFLKGRSIKLVAILSGHKPQGSFFRMNILLRHSQFEEAHSSLVGQMQIR